MRHSSGPWFVANTHINGMEGQRNIDTLDGRHVCWTTRGWADGESEANARLIAASPELLETVKACEAVFASWIEAATTDAGCTNEELAKMTSAVLKKCAESILKAEP